MSGDVSKKITEYKIGILSHIYGMIKIILLINCGYFQIRGFALVASSKKHSRLSITGRAQTSIIAINRE